MYPMFKMMCYFIIYTQEAGSFNRKDRHYFSFFPIKLFFTQTLTVQFHVLTRVFGWSACDIARSLFVISVNDGLASESGDQHSSISFPHSGSQRCGTGGLSVLFTIPPSSTIHKISSNLQACTKTLKCTICSSSCVWNAILQQKRRSETTTPSVPKIMASKGNVSKFL